jgi:hypothetical protein
MLEIAGLREDQGRQEEAEIVMIAIEGDIEMKIEHIDLQEEIEMIIEEEIEEVQMIEKQKEAEEEIEAIQEIEGEIIIKSVPGMKEREDMKMIEEGAEDMITQEIKVSKKQADRDLIVKIEKIDMKKILNEVIEEIEKKGQTIMIKIRDLKTKETVKNNIILPERKAKAQKISQNKMIIKRTTIPKIIIKQVTKKKTA